MSRLQNCFAALKQANKTALVPFVTAGDPHPDVTVPLMHAMVAAGANVIELGVPFSDPMADGPVIQRASERALAAGMSLRKTLSIVSSFREQDADTPVVLMGYLNPIEVMGYQQFSIAASEAGVDGVLIVDLPPDESNELANELAERSLDQIFLLAPTSTPDRIKRITEQASGFVYYVSLKGVTGSSRLNVQDVAEKLASIRAVTTLPLGVGFGISDPETAASMAAIADAVVVGSVLVNRVESLVDEPDRIPDAVAAILTKMRQAMDNKQD